MIGDFVYPFNTVVSLIGFFDKKPEKVQERAVLLAVIVREEQKLSHYKSVKYTGSESGWLSPDGSRIYECGWMEHVQAAVEICRLHKVVTSRLSNIKYIEKILNRSQDTFLIEAGWKHIPVQ